MSAACTPTTIKECQKLIAIANQTVADTEDITNDRQTRNPEAALQAAKVMEESAITLSQLDLRDEQLQQYQTQLVKVYQQHAQATRSFVTAYENKDKAQLQQAQQQIQQASTSERELVTKINQYCLKWKNEMIA